MLLRAVLKLRVPAQGTLNRDLCRTKPSASWWAGSP